MAKAPKSMINYNYAARSSRAGVPPQSRQPQRQRSPRKLVMGLAVLVLLLGGGFYAIKQTSADKSEASTTKVATQQSTVKQKTAATTKTETKATTVEPSVCDDNTVDKIVFVSVFKRHLWACEGNKQVHDSAVITGMEQLAADLTPRGTFYVSAKQTNLHLRGSDSTGSWDDFVNYWMPYLHNQYGTYGFHDATWRPDSEFGNVDPNSMDGSHGCVELPLETAAWLYNWGDVGLAVTVTD